MRLMSVRLLVGHVVVGLIGALVMYGMVRLMAPEIFDANLRREGTRRIAAGDYRADVPVPVETELAEVARWGPLAASVKIP